MSTTKFHTHTKQQASVVATIRMYHLLGKCKLKLKWSRYRPGVAQRVGRGIALFFHDRGTRKGVSGQQHAPAPLYPRERPGTHFTGGWVDPRSGLDGQKTSSPPVFDPGPSSPSQSLYRLSYRAHHLLGTSPNSTPEKLCIFRTQFEYGCQNKQRLFQRTALIDWFL